MNKSLYPRNEREHRNYKIGELLFGYTRTRFDGVYDRSMPTDQEYLLRIEELANKMNLMQEFSGNDYGDDLKVFDAKFIEKVYYIHDYYPTGTFGEKQGNYSILSYKHKNSESIFQFITLEIEAAIDAMIAYICPQRPVHLIAAPTSKANQRSVLCDSISIVVGNLNKRYGGYYRLLDESSCINRISDVEESYMTGTKYRNPDIRKATMRISRTEPEDYYIILDDIVTTGSMLKACSDLINADFGHTYTLVVGRTAYESTEQFSQALKEMQIIQYQNEQREARLEYREWLDDILDATGESEDEFWSHES